MDERVEAPVLKRQRRARRIAWGAAKRNPRDIPKKRFRPDGAEGNVDNAKEMARQNQFRGVLWSHFILRPCGAPRWGVRRFLGFRFAAPQAILLPRLRRLRRGRESIPIAPYLRAILVSPRDIVITSSCLAPDLSRDPINRPAGTRLFFS